MATRQNSFPYVFILSVIGGSLSMVLWGALETSLVDAITQQDQWMSGRTFAQIAQETIILSWEWLPFILLLGIGMEWLIASRLPGPSSGNIAIRAFTLVIVNALMVLFAFVFSLMGGPIFELARDGGTATDALQELSWLWIVAYAEDIVAAYVPAFFIIAADVYYFWAPIRDDVFGGIRR